MAVEAQECPKCGAAIQFSEGQAEVVCTYCGATVVRSTVSAAGATSVKKEIEAEKLIQETVERERRLHNNGQPATAKIITSQTTDIFRSAVEGRAVLMSFAVEVQPEDESSFNTETKALVGLVAVDKYQPGTVLDVRYDPQDHALVSVEGRHGVPESNPEEQARQMEAQSQAATSDKGDAGSVTSWVRLMEAQSLAATPAADASTPSWGKPRAAGTMPVPAQFDPVTNLGTPTAVYRHQGTMLFAALSGAKPKELVLYQDGLAFHTSGKEIHTWRWPEVTAILTNMPFVVPEHGGIGYATHEYMLLKGNGEKLILDDDLGIAEIEKLIQPIKDAVYALLYPPLAQYYLAGQAVTFGPVTVHQSNGLEMGGKTFAWADIIEVKVDNGRLTTTMRDDHKYEVRTSGIPNVELLCQLIGVELEPTQLWAS
jgi:ribosomal protein S27E